MDKTSLQQKPLTLREEKLLDWDSVQTSFDKSFGNEIYTSWLKHISLLKEFNDHVVLGVKTRFFRISLSLYKNMV